jgi:hypothetical protein
MKIKQLMAICKLGENEIPNEVMDLHVGDSLYDKKYIVIKNFLKEYLTLKRKNNE